MNEGYLCFTKHRAASTRHACIGRRRERTSKRSGPGRTQFASGSLRLGVRSLECTKQSAPKLACCRLLLGACCGACGVGRCATCATVACCAVC